jgi:putative lipase involved disintegration of autophagic bodies
MHMVIQVQLDSQQHLPAEDSAWHSFCSARTTYAFVAVCDATDKLFVCLCLTFVLQV